MIELSIILLGIATIINSLVMLSHLKDHSNDR